jgi:hypothetical protein
MVGLSLSCSPSLHTKTLAAQGRLVGMAGDHYVAEAVALDEEGNELGSCEAEFTTDKAPSPPATDHE